MQSVEEYASAFSTFLISLIWIFLCFCAFETISCAVIKMKTQTYLHQQYVWAVRLSTRSYTVQYCTLYDDINISGKNMPTTLPITIYQVTFAYIECWQKRPKIFWIRWPLNSLHSFKSYLVQMKFSVNSNAWYGEMQLIVSNFPLDL